MKLGVVACAGGEQKVAFGKDIEVSGERKSSVLRVENGTREDILPVGYGVELIGVERKFAQKPVS